MLFNEKKRPEGQDPTDNQPEASGRPPSYESSTSATAARTSFADSSTSPTVVVPPAPGPSVETSALFESTPTPSSFSAAAARTSFIGSSTSSPTTTVSPAAGLSKASPVPTPSPSMRSNFTQIVTPNRGITSKTVLDLALPQLPTPHGSRSVPGDFTTHDGSRPNLYLSSQNHAIQASLQITDSSFSDTEASPAKRAFIVAESEKGNVTVEIESRIPSATLHICAESKNGNVIIRIPKDFHGSIKCRCKRLQQNPMYVRCTPRVKENISVLSIHETELYAFIGDASALQAQASNPTTTDAKLPLEAGEQHDPGSSKPSASTSTPESTTSSWTGDQVEAIAHNGRIKICYALLEGEEKEEEGELNTLVRYAQESGPISGFVKYTARGMTKAFQKKKKEPRE